MSAAARADAVVIGAGPAGGACAATLARLGARVVLLSRPRPEAIEGLSARTIAGLRAAGLERAAAAAGPMAPRDADWAGEQGRRGEEAPVSRVALERALLEDAQDAGARAWAAQAGEVGACAAGWRVGTTAGPIEAPVVIDARGRQLRGATARGPALVAWSERWQLREAASPGSSLYASAAGWCWVVARPDGTVQLQWVGGARAGGLAQRTADWRDGLARMAPALLSALQRGERMGGARACAATARTAMPATLEAPGYLRAGDAALAIDPLSGHGVHEALALSRAVVAGAHTYLQGGAWRPVAGFLAQRVRESWSRTLGVAAGFYGAQADHAGGEFWRRTAGAYRALAQAAALRDAGPARIEQRAVLDGWTIRMEDVWVGPAMPRGAWARAGASTGDMQ